MNEERQAESRGPRLRNNKNPINRKAALNHNAPLKPM
jgi:hypothetical protein